MSIEDKLKQRYIEGKVEAKLEIAERLLVENFEISFVAEVTGLSLQSSTELKKRIMA